MLLLLRYAAIHPFQCCPISWDLLTLTYDLELINRNFLPIQ